MNDNKRILICYLFCINRKQIIILPLVFALQVGQQQQQQQQQQIELQVRNLGS